MKQKTEQRSSKPSGYMPERSESRDVDRSLNTSVHSSQEVEAAHVSVRGGTNEQNVVYSGNRLFIIQASKRKEILTQTATWMNLEGVRLRGRSQLWKTEHGGPGVVRLRNRV